ncbi:hypothetical protein V6Z11_A09G153400 [Gossypium hirsutum]
MSRFCKVSLQPSKNGTALKVQKDVAKKPAALLRLGLSYARVKLISDSNLLRAWIFSDSDLLQVRVFSNLDYYGLELIQTNFLAQACFPNST